MTGMIKKRRVKSEQNKLSFQRSSLAFSLAFFSAVKNFHGAPRLKAPEQFALYDDPESPWLG
jgi:hypothetical protein